MEVILTMVITVYFLEKELKLIDSEEKEFTEEQNVPGIYVTEVGTKEQMQKLIVQIDESDWRTVYARCKSVPTALAMIQQSMVLIQAAGGMVQNEHNEILMIHRRGKWDLPKGKREDGEAIEDCAVREVREETGLTMVEIERPLLVTYHTYWLGSDHILKESHWFSMKATSKEPFKPQKEEDIVECRWVPVQQVAMYCDNTHGSIKDVLKIGIAGIKVNSVF